jgi:glyoxylase-like metal-dependent hydrolase (beta-lactamase superfamily II)
MEQVLPGFRLLKGSVNSALLERNGKQLLIDSGEIDSAPGGGLIDWVFFTHHHRDQCSSVSRLVATGAKLAVPVREKQFFDQANQFWDSADNILDHRYDFRPHLFTLRDSVPVTRAVTGRRCSRVGRPEIPSRRYAGHTDGSVSYLVDLGASALLLRAI